MWRKRIFKILLTLFILATGVFLAARVYITKFENVLNDRIALVDDRCINVNPMIIKRKLAYIDYMKTFMSGNSNENVVALMSNYNDLAKASIIAEGEWLRKDDGYLNHTDISR